ncbi:MAG: ATP-binding protein [Candidatus Nitrospinota bacterium M3_3B_026]
MGLFRKFFWRAAAFMVALSGVVLWAGAALSPAEAFVLAAGAAAAAAGLLALYFSRMVSKPLERLAQGVTRFSMGGFDTPLTEEAFPEAAALADKLNHMAREQESRIAAGGAQARSSEAILASIEEGVLAVDQDMRIIKLNPKARQILNIFASRPEGQPLEEAVDNGELARFAREGLNTGRPDEKEISSGPRGEGRLLLARSPLFHGDGEYWGMVMTIRDVTRLRRLENLRSDFAASVSHELRTPLTTVKGFLETLLAGAVDDPEKARSFLKIMERHIGRLTHIIEDLLSLSRIERDSEADAVHAKTLPVKETIQRAIDHVAPKAERKNIRIELDLDEFLSAPINAPLLESGVANLLDNAVNYSGEGTAVRVSAGRGGGYLSIHVRDEGPGIEKAHLGRIFERFYRVDDARSRELGGTGLGLSLVKHIALAHGGRVSVRSAPGEGSVFSIHIPLSADTGRKEEDDGENG